MKAANKNQLLTFWSALYNESVGHTTRAIFFQVKLDKCEPDKCKLLTLNDHNPVGSEEDIVSKQTILT